MKRARSLRTILALGALLWAGCFGLRFLLAPGQPSAWLDRLQSVLERVSIPSAPTLAPASPLIIERAEAEKIRTLGARAEAARKEGRYKDAIASLNEVLVLTPNSPDLMREIGRLAYADRDFALAVGMARKVMASKGGAGDAEDGKFLANALVMQKEYGQAADVVIALAEAAPTDAAKGAYYGKLGDLYGLWGKPDAALDAYAKAAFLSDEAGAHLRLARMLESQVRDKEAVAAYERALAKAPDPKAELSLASLLVRVGDPARAADLYRKALANTPEGRERLRTLLLFGELMGAQGERAAALRAFEEALPLAVSDAGLNLTVGRMRLELGRPGDAIGPLSASLALRDDPSCRLLLAEACAGAGDAARALSTYQLALKDRRPRMQRVTILGRMAALRLKTGDGEEAGKLFLASYEAGGPSVALVAAGRAFLSAKAYDEAGEAFSRRLGLSPREGEAEVQGFLGEVRLALGRDREAAESFRLALQPGATLPEASRAAFRIGLAKACVKTGQTAEAVATLRAAPLDDLPVAERAEALVILGQGLAAQNDFPSARDAFGRAAGLPGLEDDGRADIFEELGRAALSCGELEMAEAGFRRSLAAGSGHAPQVRRSLAEALERRGEFRAAVEVFAEAPAGEATPADRLIMARCSVKMDDRTSAIQNLELVLKTPDGLSPDGLSEDDGRAARTALGWLYADEKRYAEASALLRQAFAAASEPADQVRLARLERLAGETDKAADRLAATTPDALNAELRLLRLDELAVDCDLLDRYEQAVAAMEQAIALAPTADRYYRLGKMHADRKRFEPAIAAYKKAVELAEERRYLTALGDALNEHGELADAARAFERALSSL